MLACIFAGALALAGCASDSHVGADDARLTNQAPRVTGIERAAVREHNRLVAAFGGQYRAPAAERNLEEVVRRITAASERPDQAYRVTILNSPVVNAFALPTGNVYVTRGLLALANDNAEIAAVLAHEISHVTANHALARAELEQRSALVSRVVSEVLNDPGASKVVRAESRVTLAGFSRTQELEADRMGVGITAKAGFDPYGAARFLVSLGRNAGTASGKRGKGMDFLSSHPTTPERVSQAILAARQIGPPSTGETGRDSYLNSIDGIVYGEDPADGVIRGRRFEHPGMAIAFEAPEGFRLENTAQAVLAVSPAGGQALRFDGVKLSPTESLESFLASGWVEGLDIAEMQTTTVNGMPAATAVARGKEWTFLLGAVRADGTVFRLLYASRASSGSPEANFRSAFDSIRRLSADEVRAIRPARIAMVSASHGETAETMAERMAPIENRLQRFLIINGLKSGEVLLPGRRYKIVTE